MRWLCMDEVLKFIRTGDKSLVRLAEKFQAEKNRCGLMTASEYKPVSRIFFNKASEARMNNGIKEIKGVSASAGKIRGRVRIILDPKREKMDFAKGDILVTSMTRPEFLPLMKKASAFITDEGGITCHAAIVAREMKKPCIIGMKNATDVLRDGQMVEVDANKGVVRIL
jgi:phosphoenolpyruvate synthase/pyruvate phosphate dikinase